MEKEAGSIGVTRTLAAQGCASKNGNKGHGRRARTKPPGHLPQSCSQSKKSPHDLSRERGEIAGVVTWFDNFCVLLRRDGHSQLVYKHAISTIMPGHPIQLFEGAEEAPAAEKV